MDARIGKRGAAEPSLCAISSLALKRPYVTHALGGEYFCRVLAKHDHLWSEDVASQLKAMTAGGKSQPVMVEKEVSK